MRSNGLSLDVLDAQLVRAALQSQLRQTKTALVGRGIHDAAEVEQFMVRQEKLLERVTAFYEAECARMGLKPLDVEQATHAR